MISLTITIDKDKSFDKIDIKDNVQILRMEWAELLTDWEKQSLLYYVEHFVCSVLNKNKSISVLDISQLDGWKSSNLPTNYLQEIYYPYSVESVFFYEPNIFRRISAPGAKSIRIYKAPHLEFVEYGKELEEVSFSESGISHIDLPPNIRLGRNAFKGCKFLKSITLQSGTDVPPSAFEDCVNLDEIYLPDDLLVIEPNVFKNCKNLKHIYGGKNVKLIFASAFQGIGKLETLGCTNLYKISNNNISDKEWENKFRPLFSKRNEKELISKYINELPLNKINNVEEFIANEILATTEFHYGFVVNYQQNLRRWIVWSFTSESFYATNGVIKLQENDIVTFTITKKPHIYLENSIFLNWPLVFIDNPSLAVINKDSDNYQHYNYLIEYFKPRYSVWEYFQKCKATVENLNIPQIIDSYKIIDRTWWQRYPGRDDSQFFERIAKSDYTDIYLNELLPQEKYEDYYNGCYPMGFNEEEENRKRKISADFEAKSIIEKAHRIYSKDEHICKLMEDYFLKRRKLENDIESVYHIQAIKNFLKYRCYNSIDGKDSLEELYDYSLNDIINDNKYNESISWYYQHGWVDSIDAPFT